MKGVEKKRVDETAGETEGARRATGVFPGGAPAGEPPAGSAAETGGVAKALRRRFTAEGKGRDWREAGRGGAGGGVNPALHPPAADHRALAPAPGCRPGAGAAPPAALGRVDLFPGSKARPLSAQPPPYDAPAGSAAGTGVSKPATS